MISGNCNDSSAWVMVLQTISSSRGLLTIVIHVRFWTLTISIPDYCYPQTLHLACSAARPARTHRLISDTAVLHGEQPTSLASSYSFDKRQHFIGAGFKMQPVSCLHAQSVIRAHQHASSALHGLVAFQLGG